MPDDVSDVMSKFSSMLNNKENIPDNIKEIIGSLNKDASNNGTPDTSSTDPLKNISPEMISNFMNMLNNKKEEPNISDVDGSSESNASNSNPFGNIDMATLMKMKGVMDKMSSKDDPRSNLLISLKPYLNDNRRGKVDQYIRAF